MSNQSYSVQATVAGTVVITLPPSPATGDVVTVTGQSANSWKVVPNSGQVVGTDGVPGNVAPGTAWSPRLAPRVWHWLSSDSTGNVLLAGEAAGGVLNTSTDGGLTWTAGNSPGGIWISSDMTAKGERLYAVQYGGGLYRSTDAGRTWTPLTSTSPGVTLANQAYEGISVSADGQRIVASVQNGPIYVSADGGLSWRAGTVAGTTTPVVAWWRGLDSSADGLTAISAGHNGELYRSLDGGSTWSPLQVVVNGVPASDNWYRAKMSEDGSVIVLVGNSFGGTAAGKGIYLSRDRGQTWTRPFTMTADYSAIALSGDGRVVTVTVSNPNPNPQPGTVARATGRVLRSTDGGASFNPLTLPGADTDWRAVAASADGNKIAAAAGLFDGGVAGQLYTSLGSRTSFGSVGSVTGGQGQSLAVTYQGNGKYSASTASGSVFTIR